MHGKQAAPLQFRMTREKFHARTATDAINLQRLCVILLLAVAGSGRASATLLRKCSVNSSDLTCRLSTILHALYVTAVVLAVLLVLVILLAVRLYRKSKAERGGVL